MTKTRVSINENKNLSEQMAKVLSGLTDEQKEKVNTNI